MEIDACLSTLDFKMVECLLSIFDDEKVRSSHIGKKARLYVCVCVLNYLFRWTKSCNICFLDINFTLSPMHYKHRHNLIILIIF